MPESAAPLLTDAVGHAHTPATGVVRIVSLVPSLTELLHDLGLGDAVVGRTGFCIHPRAAVRRVPKVGGTKTVDLPRVRKLAPTHLLVNVDENPRDVVDALSSFVPHVVVTHPIEPEDNLALYRLLGGLFGREEQALSLCAAFSAELALTRAFAASLPRERVLYLIWKSPWMTVARDTYISRMLALVGWDTVPAESQRRYPPVDLDEALLLHVRHVLLSTEPYAFRERHREAVAAELPPDCHPAVSLVDGEMTSWYGSRAIAGLRYLRDLRTRLSA